MSRSTAQRIAILQGAGYVGQELMRCLSQHPSVVLTQVSSRSQAGQPLHAVEPLLRGICSGRFIDPQDFDAGAADAIFISAEHGHAASLVGDLIDAGFGGPIIDLSADFRLRDAAAYPRWYGREHPRPELLPLFEYGLADASAPGSRPLRVANPGCFATGLQLALRPLCRRWSGLDVVATALTGATGSGVTPQEGTHFPRRSGNVRAYKVLQHQHLAEVLQTLGDVQLDFIPVSGPWVRGIWGSLRVRLADGISPQDVADAFSADYAERELVRLWPGRLPELRWSVGTPFCDLGWIVEGRTAVIGFGLDNMLKGAAGQAIQNLNRAFGWPQSLGLLGGVSDA